MTTLRDILAAASYAIRLAVSTYRHTRQRQQRRVIGDTGPF